MKTLTKYYEDLVLNPEPNCFCMLKPGFAEYKDEFEKLLKLNGWKIIAQCIKKFTREEIEDFYLMHKDKPFYHKLCDYMITDDCVCYTCYKHCQDPFKDMDAFKKKIRDEWGEDEMKNGMHSSDCKENMKKECLIAFNTVNEKLKISKHDLSVITYQEFYDLVKKYLKCTNSTYFHFNVLDNDEYPTYLHEGDKFKVIYIDITDNNELIIHFTGPAPVDYATLELNEIKNIPVDFIPAEYVEQAVEYMKKYTKSY